MKFSLVGLGKMSNAVKSVALEMGHQYVDGVSRLDPTRSVVDQIGRPDVVFEFSGPDAAAEHLRQLIATGSRVVCGTTGWKPSEVLLKSVGQSQSAALLIAANFSIGMALFRHALREITRKAVVTGLYRPSLEEVHHVHKRDRPSGSALRLAGDVLDAFSDLGGWRLEGSAPDDDKLEIRVERQGEIPGTHRLRLDSADDCILLEHRAHGREGFARGAVLAGVWLCGRVGLFEFEAVLTAGDGV